MSDTNRLWSQRPGAKDTSKKLLALLARICGWKAALTTPVVHNRNEQPAKKRGDAPDAGLHELGGQMGIKDNIDGWDRNERMRRDADATNAGRAKRLAPAAAARIAEMVRETVSIVSKYEYRPLSTANLNDRTKLQGGPAFVFSDGQEPSSNGRYLGRGWCLGMENRPVVIVEDGTLGFGGVTQVERPMKPSSGGFRRKTPLQRSHLNDYDKAMLRWRALRNQGLDEGDWYFELDEWDPKRMSTFGALELIPLTVEGWRRMPSNFEGFDADAKRHALQIERDDPSMYHFESDYASLRPVGCEPGLQFGYFDDGVPTLIQYGVIFRGTRDDWTAWDLEKSLTRRITCLITAIRLDP